MQINTELRNMFSYSIVLIIPTLLLIIILVVILHRKSNIKNINITTNNTKDIESIKNKYLHNIQIISNNLNKNIISKRYAYQLLSKIVRNFIYETTNIKVQYCTLEEIKKLNINELSELLEEYYQHEFARHSNGNIKESIKKTKKVITKWK